MARVFDFTDGFQFQILKKYEALELGEISSVEQYELYDFEVYRSMKRVGTT